MSLFSHHDLPFAFYPGVAFEHSVGSSGKSDEEARRNTSVNHESLGRKGFNQTGGNPGHITAGYANSPDDLACIEGVVVEGLCGQLLRPPNNPGSQGLKRKQV